MELHGGPLGPKACKRAMQLMRDHLASYWFHLPIGIMSDELL